MSFPYHQYVDYSNPATPRVYAWEVASSTSTSEHDAALQMPPQDPQQQLQPQQISPSQLQPQQISPSQLQLHQLPLPLPQAQHPPRHTSPQELRSQHQQPAQYAPQQPQQQQRAPAPQTIHVPPPPAAGQPQYRFETITEQDFVSATAPRRRGASKPPLHVDTARPASSASAPAGSPSALSSAGAGPLRVPHTRAHAQAAHPYRGARPQSRAASGSGSGQAQHGAVRSRGVSEMHASSPGAQTPLGAAAATTSAGGVVPPAVGTAMAVSCPAADSWRESLLGLSGASETRTPGAGGSFDPEGTPRAAAFSVFPEPARRYTIRTDVHYSTEENVMTAMFELPGVKRGDLRITLSVCPFSRVRQVNIAGTMRAILPLRGHAVRERKFGEFCRTLAVPPETKPEDVAVALEDGILTLKIPCGTPAAAEAPQEIPVP